MENPSSTALDIAGLARQLVRAIALNPSAAVAFSGGVDSAVVACAAFQALGERSIAITGVGSATPQSDLQSARAVAIAIGIQHIEIATDEISDPEYVKNDSKRCFYCKSTLYQTIRRWTNENRFDAILSGTNLDDLNDYRPGIQAAAEHNVLAPLADAMIDKQLVRQLASYWGLAVADKPASPCLASRIAYGQSVTPQRLRSIESLEQLLAEFGFIDVRVRLHADELVRIELHLQNLQRACEAGVRTAIVERCQQLGFKFVTLDLAGRQSGSLNKLLPVLQ